MNETISLLLPILIPVLFGALILLMPQPKDRKPVLAVFSMVLLLTFALVIAAVFTPERQIVLFYLTAKLPVMFRLDAAGRFFLVLVSVVWVLAGFFSFTYMKHENNEKRYFGFFLLVYGVLIGLGMSGNLVTMYAFYEFMTIASFPLVVHNQSREAVLAGLKYLFFSFFGAYMALFGLFFLCRYTNTITFAAGGTLNPELIAGKEGLLLLVAGLMVIGFSVKAGMLPLHAWLVAAHPVAPSPASAVLSGIIVKCGVFAIIRVVFYVFGAAFLRGTWVQYLLLTLSLVTVFMGSMLAYGEDVLKKRLAYSTVSQLSYILFGIFLLSPEGLTGSLLHMAAHATIKATLFLCAGAIIFKTGLTRVTDLTGIGKKMPVTIWCFTIASLGLIGIPPTSGFISKWHLAIGALESGIPVYRYLGPVILLVSALLTAGYLLPVTIRGFFPGDDFDYAGLEKCEGDGFMVLPLLILTALSVVIGMFPEPVLNYIAAIVGEIL